MRKDVSLMTVQNELKDVLCCTAIIWLLADNPRSAGCWPISGADPDRIGNIGPMVTGLFTTKKEGDGVLIFLQRIPARPQPMTS